MRQNKRKLISIGITAIVSTALFLSGCSNNHTKQQAVPTNKTENITTQKQKSNNESTELAKSTYDKLANANFKNGTYGYVTVNNNKSTLNPKSWKTNKVIYQNLDNLNRTSHSNTGYLEKRNLAKGSLRVRQYIQPTGWHYNTRNGEQLYNRGHLIAYSISAGIDQNGTYNPKNQSGDQNNPKNLFTQTAYSNQQLQTIYETKVRDVLKAGKKVVFQATPIFKGNEKMARGINLQAISTDKSLNFNVYIFNIQPGYRFNYSNGRAIKDNSITVKELPANLQSNYNDNQTKNRYNSSNKLYKMYRERQQRNHYYKHPNEYNKKFGKHFNKNAEAYSQQSSNNKY